MKNNIHPTAIIADGAKIGENVFIGPYCVIGNSVEIQNHVTLKSHIVIEGRTNIGHHTIIHPFAAIGTIPQDLKFSGEGGVLKIGNHNKIREHVTINIGTTGGGMLTSIGDHNLIMVGAHIGHDCRLGNHIILVNNATLAGHVTVDDHAILGGLSAVHQFCHIGKMAMVGGMTGVENDIIPYGMVTGNRAVLKGLNIVGMDRAGFTKDVMGAMRSAFKMIFSDIGNIKDRLITAEAEYSEYKPVIEVISFLRRDSKRRFVTP